MLKKIVVAYMHPYKRAHKMKRVHLQAHRGEFEALFKRVSNNVNQLKKSYNTKCSMF